jgi:small multidrug resistance family-3 protein
VRAAASAAAEIAGCCAFWLWARDGRRAPVPAAGLAALAPFARRPTRVDARAAGRAFAVCGGVYIAASPIRLGAVGGVRTDRRNLAAAVLRLAGAGVILSGPRRAAATIGTAGRGCRTSPAGR